MRDFHFHTSIIWSINYNASIIESNIQCDVIKQPGETVSGLVPCNSCNTGTRALPDMYTRRPRASADISGNA